MKPIWRSKTLWVNVLTFIVAVLSGQYGALPLSAEQTAAILAVVNIALRLVTRTAVTTGASSPPAA